ncbi:uncharacterized protein LOC144167844 [Haemaphysalis longicornis]
MANADIPGCSWHGAQAAASPHDHLLAAASPQGHFLAAAAHQDCPTSPSSPRCFPAPATWNASSAASPLQWPTQTFPAAPGTALKLLLHLETISWLLLPTKTVNVTCVSF